MSATLDAFLRSWPFDPWLLAALLVCAGIYLRGWRKCAMLSRPGSGVRAGRPEFSKGVGASGTPFEDPGRATRKQPGGSLCPSK